MTAEMSVQITLALSTVYLMGLLCSPSAGIGRQDKLKFY